MNREIARFWMAIVSLFCATPAFAADISLEADDGLDLIFISGEIDESDVAHFQRLAVSSSQALIVLESPGGALDPALKIGEIIRLKGFSTYVPDGTVCTSSCALIWVAGQTRYIATTASVGFHASYVLSGGRQIEKGVGNARVGRYLTLLNLPERAVIFATSAPPEEIAWINTADPSQSGISFEIFDLDNSETTSSSSSIVSANRPARLVDVFNWEQGTWKVRNFDDRDGCYMIAEFFSEGEANNYSWVGAGLRIDGSSYLAFHNQRFQAVKNDTDYKIDLAFMTGEKVDDGWGTRDFGGMVHEGGMTTLTAFLEWKDLEKDLANEELIFFSMNGEVIDVFPLKGSRRAVRELKSCVGSAGVQSSDPFAR